MTKYAQSSSKKKSLLISKQEGGNRLEDMTGYGKDWPGGMKEDLLKEPAGKDPVEVFEQLELDLTKRKKRDLRIAGIDKTSGMVLINIIRGGQKGTQPYEHAVDQLKLHAPGALKKLQQQGFV